MRPGALRALAQLQTGFVRLIGSVLQLGLSVVLLHLADAALLGRFLFFVAVVNLCTAVGGGIPNLLMRYASTTARERLPQVGWLWRHSIELCLLACAVGGVAAMAGAPFVRDTGLAVGGLLFQRVSSAALKAAGHPSLGVLLDTAVYPLVVMVAAVLVHASTGAISIGTLHLSYILAVWGAAVVGVLLTLGRPSSISGVWSAPSRTPRTVYGEIAAVTLGSAAHVVTSNAPLTLAPVFLSASDTGELGFAIRVAGFATTILISLIAYFGPAFARATTRHELLSLRRRSQYACVALYLPVPVALLALPAGLLEQLSPGLSSIKGLVLVLSVGYFVERGHRAGAHPARDARVDPDLLHSQRRGGPRDRRRPERRRSPGRGTGHGRRVVGGDGRGEPVVLRCLDRPVEDDGTGRPAPGHPTDRFGAGGGRPPGWAGHEARPRPGGVI